MTCGVGGISGVRDDVEHRRGRVAGSEIAGARARHNHTRPRRAGPGKCAILGAVLRSHDVVDDGDPSASDSRRAGAALPRTRRARAFARCAQVELVRVSRTRKSSLRSRRTPSYAHAPARTQPGCSPLAQACAGERHGTMSSGCVASRRRSCERASSEERGELDCRVELEGLMRRPTARGIEARRGRHRTARSEALAAHRPPAGRTRRSAGRQGGSANDRGRRRRRAASQPRPQRTGRQPGRERRVGIELELVPVSQASPQYTARPWRPPKAARHAPRRPSRRAPRSRACPA